MTTKSKPKSFTSRLELLNAVNKYYPDNCCSNYFGDDGFEKETDYDGDTLALYLVRETLSLMVPNYSPEDNAKMILPALDRAIDDIEAAKRGLQELIPKGRSR